MKYTPEELSVAKQIVKMVDTEVLYKPPGSIIVFTGMRKPDEELATVSCTYYNVHGTPGKNSVVRPPELQNIPCKEARKIAERFEKSRFLVIVPI